MLSNTTASALALGLFALQAAARPAHCQAPMAPAGKAVYMLSNRGQQNSVLALPIGADGLLGEGKSTATGGKGAAAIDGSTMKPSSPDALISQSALTVAGKNLFAVNAGSNSVTMFAIDAQDPTKLTMVGRPVAVPAEFPTTVAASQKNKMVCVGSTGAQAGVSCSRFSAQGMRPMDGLRPFALGQTTPPVGPPNTVSHVFFSGDETTLFATVKGDPAKNNTGFLAAFPVQAGGGKGGAAAVAAQGTMSSPQGTAVLFGASTIPGSRDLFVTDASFGAAVLSVRGGGRGAPVTDASVKGAGKVDGQKATCWATVSGATQTAFVTDVGTNRLVEMSLRDASVLGEIDLGANGDPGLVDLRAAGSFVYALSPGNGTTQAAVTVVDATSRKQVQHLELGGMGLDKNAMGMAVL